MVRRCLGIAMVDLDNNLVKADIYMVVNGSCGRTLMVVEGDCVEIVH